MITRHSDYTRVSWNGYRGTIVTKGLIFCVIQWADGTIVDYSYSELNDDGEYTFD